MKLPRARNAGGALACTVLVSLFFGWFGPAAVPSFPFQQAVTTPCFYSTALGGACIGSMTHLPVQGGIDFAFWIGGTFLLMLLTMGFLSRSNPARLIGVGIVAAMLFVMFVPVVYVSAYNLCTLAPPTCLPVSQYVSLSYRYLGTGGVYDSPVRYYVGVASSA